jgi:hypothetical protein
MPHHTNGMTRPAMRAQILINSLDAGKAQHEKVSTMGMSSIP